ncbi:MAG: hypothetical protein RMJ55_20560, partial [Roseiflexaceae bacterium]|nr:hypothetical protein [Roseiflexaceae bacterium]
TTPGTHRATYRLRGPNGLFGDPFWVEVVVRGEGVSRRPLIFIPGIMGSRLYHTTSQRELWVEDMQGDIITQFRTAWLLQNIHAPDIIATYMVGSPVNPPYQSLHTYLTAIAGYKEYPPDFTRTPLERCQQAKSERQTDITLFVFAYDWRQNNDVSVANLSQFITCIKELTGAEKVD